MSQTSADHVHTAEGGLDGPVEQFNPRRHSYPCRNPDCPLNGTPRSHIGPTCEQ